MRGDLILVRPAMAAQEQLRLGAVAPVAKGPTVSRLRPAAVARPVVGRLEGRMLAGAKGSPCLRLRGRLVRLYEVRPRAAYVLRSLSAPFALTLATRRALMQVDAIAATRPRRAAASEGPPLGISLATIDTAAVAI